MKTFLKNWFAPPTFAGDDENNHRARLLYAISLTYTGIVLLTLLGMLFGGKIPARVLVLAAVIILNGLLFLFALRRVRLGVMLVWLFASAYILITWCVGLLGTIRTPATSAYLLYVITAGMLFDVPGSIWAAVACSLAVGGLALAGNAGWLPPADHAVGITQWLTFTMLFALTGALTSFSQKLMQGALERSKKEMKERERADADLRKLLRAVEQSPASIVITNLDGTIEYVNPRFSQVTGYSFEEVVGKNPRILKTDQTAPGTHEGLWSTLTTGGEWRGEFVNQRKDGSHYTESATISPITDLNGVTTHYLAVKEDITQRKETDNKLRTSEARFRSLFEQTHDAVFMLGLQGQILTANQRAADMLGYAVDEFASMSILDVSAQDENVDNILTGLQAGEVLSLYESHLRRKDGQLFPVEVNLELVKDKSGAPLHIQVVARDISRRKAAEDALLKANEQLNLRIAEAEQLQATLREQALIDPLTGLYNRRYLSDTLLREIIRAEREKINISIIAMDVDFFKHINDTYGHPVGDQFLIAIATMLKTHARGSDFISRFGGDEFLLVLPGTPQEAAIRRAGEIQERAAQMRVNYQGQELGLTLSFGIATYPEHGRDVNEVIINADKALYISKHSGRNRVTISGADSGELSG